MTFLRLGYRSALFARASSVGLACVLACQVNRPAHAWAQREGPAGSAPIAKKALSATGRGYIEVRSVPSDTMPPPDAQQGPRVVDRSLRYSEFDKLSNSLPQVEKAIAVREIPMEIRRADHVIQGQALCTTHDFVDFTPTGMARGRFLSPSDEERHRASVVLSSAVAMALFPMSDPVGESVKIGGTPFTVIGVAKTQGGDANKAKETGKQVVYLPLATSKLRFGEDVVDPGAEHSSKIQVSRILLRFREGVDLEGVAATVRSILKPFHPRGGVEAVVVLPENGAK